MTTISAFCERFWDVNDKPGFLFFESKTYESTSLTRAGDAVSGFHCIHRSVHMTLEVCFIVRKKIIVIEIECDRQMLAEILVRIELALLANDESPKPLPSHSRLK